MTEQQIPPGMTPIDTEQFLLAIGELYVQVSVLRRIVAQEQQQRQQAARNGTAGDAVQLER